MKTRYLLAAASVVLFCNWAFSGSGKGVGSGSSSGSPRNRTTFNTQYALPDTQLEKAKWLLGTWKNKNSRGSLYETWTVKDANSMHAKSYRLKNGDTVLAETIHLRETGGKLYYIVTAQNQNDNKPVSFESTLVSEKQMVFENPAHDFPQKITYTRVEADSLFAEISAVVDGKLVKQPFAMKKIR